MLITYFARMRADGYFQQFIHPFSQKLLALDTDAMPLHEYSKRYLQHLLHNHLYYLKIYATVLGQLVEHSPKTPGEIKMVDYGAGNGLLGMFAKFAGFKKVWLCDMDADFVDASQMVAAKLSIQIDGFVTGNIEALRYQLAHEQIDAVVGTDVIEHIYNLEHFFETLAVMNVAMVTVFTTASNPQNFIKCRQLKKLQLQDELHGSDPSDSLLAGAQKTEAFFVLRKQIISENFPELAPSELLTLSKATMGLIKADILAATINYLQTGKLPLADNDSTNTCNPFNGSWTERILSIDAYKKIYTENNFKLVVRNGFYNDDQLGWKKYVNSLANEIVKVTGIYAAPFISLIGYKS